MKLTLLYNEKWWKISKREQTNETELTDLITSVENTRISAKLMNAPRIASNQLLYE
jgi:hypothetical protein